MPRGPVDTATGGGTGLRDAEAEVGRDWADPIISATHARLWRVPCYARRARVRAASGTCVLDVC
jgi:hypothetical protein